MRLLDTRPILLISSTSWTPDENFDILADAMSKLDSMIQVWKILVLTEHVAEKWIKVPQNTPSGDWKAQPAY